MRGLHFSQHAETATREGGQLLFAIVRVAFSCLRHARYELFYDRPTDPVLPDQATLFGGVIVRVASTCTCVLQVLYACTARLHTRSMHIRLYSESVYKPQQTVLRPSDGASPNCTILFCSIYEIGPPRDSFCYGTTQLFNYHLKRAISQNPQRGSNDFVAVTIKSRPA